MAHNSMYANFLFAYIAILVMYTNFSPMERPYTRAPFRAAASG
jgi:hypothetical protein